MLTPLSRRRFLKSSGPGAAAITGPAGGAALAGQLGNRAAATPQEALELLMAGNRRWVAGRARHPRQSVARRDALSHTQHPFATVFSCIDSRVPPELVFDRGLGDLAVIRTGAQVLDQGVVFGSIELTPDHLGTPLILVMGHQRCGAVVAAIHTIESGGHAPGHIQAIVDALRPAYDVAIHQPGDLVDNMVRAQTKLAVESVKNDPLIRKFMAKGELGVAGGYYSLDTGAVSITA
ncbi:MAG: carbonic anhydrase [Solirubrobacteraceae bacterium]